MAGDDNMALAGDDKDDRRSTMRIHHNPNFIRRHFGSSTVRGCFLPPRCCFTCLLAASATSCLLQIIMSIAKRMRGCVVRCEPPQMDGRRRSPSPPPLTDADADGSSINTGEPLFHLGQCIQHWWARWMESAEEKARPRGRHNKPFWYNGVITAPARYGEMTYAGAKCKPQWLYKVGTFNGDFYVVPQSFISTHKMPLSLPAAAPAAAAAPAG